MLRDRLKWPLAAAVLLSGAAAFAADSPEPAPEPRRPLMDLLDRAGAAGPLDDLGINIFGHAEASYTYNFDEPDDDINAGRVFDFEHDELIFNQLNLTVERLVDPADKKFDIGGRVEFIYGADAGLIHSNGLFDWYDSPRDPENQWDLNQAYLDVTLPVGNGLRLRGGKFVTLLGYELINPTGNALYSHSYLFGFTIPFTHTGILGTYNVNESFSINAGVTRGWEQSTEDNNEAIDFLGSVNWVINDKFTLFIGNTTGPQQADDEDNIRTVFNAILTVTVNEKLKLALDAVYGWEEDVPGLGDSDWYGVAGYAHYTINDHLALNGRVEWLNDEDGSRGIGTTVYEATLGLAITPLPLDPWGMNLKLRPEIRYDYAEDDFFDGGSAKDQFTAAIDVIFSF
jgi:hypothetical protein